MNAGMFPYATVLALSSVVPTARALVCDEANDCSSAAECDGKSPGDACGGSDRVCVVVDIDPAWTRWGEDDICCGCNYTDSTLSASDGAPIRDDTLELLLDQHVPTGNAHSSLLVFTQCYGGSMVDEFADREGTSVLSATVPAQTARYGGYHDDAAAALYAEDGRTSDDVHEAGTDGASSLEDPIAQGPAAPLDEVGSTGIGSRHVLVYAGQPEEKDVEDRDTIEQNFAGDPDTTVTTVGGAGQADGWDYPGTFAGLRDALVEISAWMDPTEQFVLFVTDHGGIVVPNQAEVFEVEEGQWRGTLVVGLSDEIVADMAAEPDNQPQVCVVGPYWMFPVTVAIEEGEAEIGVEDLGDHNVPYAAGEWDDYADKVGCVDIAEGDVDPDGEIVRIAMAAWLEGTIPEVWFHTGAIPKGPAVDEPVDTGDDVGEDTGGDTGGADSDGPGVGGDGDAEASCPGCSGSGASAGVVFVLGAMLRRRRA